MEETRLRPQSNLETYKYVASLTLPVQYTFKVIGPFHTLKVNEHKNELYRNKIKLKCLSQYSLLPQRWPFPEYRHNI